MQVKGILVQFSVQLQQEAKARQYPLEVEARRSAEQSRAVASGNGMGVFGGRAQSHYHSGQHNRLQCRRRM